MVGKLFSILENFRRGAVGLDEFRPLVRHVVDESADTDIWEAVFNIVNNLAPPPASIPPTFRGTVIKASSSWHGENEVRNIAERQLFKEIKNCTFRNVGGFWAKFFDPKSWRREQEAMLEGVLTAHDGKKWTAFPKVPDEKLVWDWLRSLEERFLDQAPYKFHTIKTANQFQEPNERMDLFLQKPAAEGSDTLWYKHVLVVGEQRKEPYDTYSFKADFIQLTCHVQGVFTDQPTRRFVHAFTLCASEIELWIFDRSGAYSSGTFDIHDEPDKFARALVGYATMDDDAMGLDTFMERQDGHRYVTLDDANGKETRLRLDKALIRQGAIVCRGRTCYGTQDSHVATFSWTSDKRKLEVEHLKRAEAMGVEGVARVVAHRQITTIAEMREGLRFSAAHCFRNEDDYFHEPLTVVPLSTKCKYPADHTSGNASGSKKRRLSNTKPSLYTPGEDSWENRNYSCLVVSPAGRVISDFRTTKELLESERDAIKAHRSLYVTGKILHRDISPNSIIITNPETANGFKGMLTNLDLAKILDSEPSGARHRTGTIQFMAVEVLRKKDHTYRHDLESFFYVLLWMCARQAWSNGFAGNQNPPRYSELRKWDIGRFKDIAGVKEGQMAVGLSRIMEEFPEALDVVKPVCLKIRKILFPFDKDMWMNIGTPIGDPDQLYNPIIAALDEAISKL
ncbi:Protein kinase domain protein [Ceratocystis platani]|uniref:Protein kinase domain protein n=1 Tax=Ceratocystis fimbriata f. sp. platani TaxID=88771 RepID=A0A0F8CN18_CERFI|nr:Protein kinase domain protein [Ceratocystis platani]